MTSNFPLVSTEWLAEHIAEVVPADGSWYLPQEGRDPEKEFLQGHIPGAVYFNTDANSRPSDLPHMMPAAEDFSAAMSELGIGDDDVIVVYDTAGLFSAARVRWMFRSFGAKRVFLLDGGLPKWKAEGRPIETGKSSRARAKFSAMLREGAVADMAQVRSASDAGTPVILDARPAQRFAGSVPEPRPGVRPGHIPGSINVPYPSLIKDGRLKGIAELKALFDDVGVDGSASVVVSCGSGVTAAIVLLALETIGHRNGALYDGSWAEWGADPSAPIEQGSGR
jgi:thiosulfate/3-mercaptopyruvate sulfurtransferase